MRITPSMFLGGLMGFVLALALPDLATHSGAFAGGTELVPDTEGALRQVCVHYVRSFHDETAPVLAGLVRALPEDVTIHVVTAEESEFRFFLDALRRAGVPHLSRLRPVVTGFAVTPWAKDRFGTLRRGRVPVLAVPADPGVATGARANEARVPYLLARRLGGMSCLSAGFRFEGGDLIADEDTMFLAANCLARNAPYDVDDRAGLIARMEAAFGKRAVVIGAGPDDVPDHHIGMYLTPLGGKVVAVADPDLGLSLWDALPADPRLPEAERADAVLALFRNVRRDLERAGFDVVRVPFVPTRMSRVYITYNNAILETREGQKRIYMPTYGIPALDAAARAVFEARGWTVLPVDVSSVYRFTGSLRCLVGVIEREG